MIGFDECYRSCKQADESSVVLAHPYGTHQFLTFYERAFRQVSPLQGGAFTLLPADT